MKNIWISSVIIGALICPVVYATEPLVANEPQLQAKEDSDRSVRAKKRRHKKQRMHQMKKRQQMKKRNAMHDGETAAEKRIEQEAELTNR